MNLKELRLKSGMKRPEFAEYFGIPYRTLQGWELKGASQGRKCPEYLFELIKYKLEKEGFIETEEAEEDQ